MQIKISYDHRPSDPVSISLRRVSSDFKAKSGNFQIRQAQTDRPAGFCRDWKKTNRTLYRFDEAPIRARAHEETEHYRIYQSYLTGSRPNPTGTGSKYVRRCIRPDAFPPDFRNLERSVGAGLPAGGRSLATESGGPPFAPLRQRPPKGGPAQE